MKGNENKQREEEQTMQKLSTRGESLTGKAKGERRKSNAKGLINSASALGDDDKILKKCCFFFSEKEKR